MAANIEAMTFFESYYQTAQRLDDAARLEWYDGILAYAFEGVEPSFEPTSVAGIVWLSVQPVMDSAAKKRSAGAKGGRPKKEKPMVSKPRKPVVSQNEKAIIISNSISKSIVSEASAQPETEAAQAPYKYLACPACGSSVSKLFNVKGHPWSCPNCGQMDCEPEMRAAL